MKDKTQNTPNNTIQEIVTSPFNVVGETFISFLQLLTNGIEFIGQFFSFFYYSVLHILKGGIRFSTTVQQMAFLGVDSLFIVLLCLGFTGLTLATILAQQIEDLAYGAELIGGAMVWSLGKELAPVLSALIIAGRAGAGMTSEIGTMKVTDQIDALRASAIPPIRYLVVPRLVACAIMVPLITFLACVIGVYAGYIAVQHISPLQITYMTYFESVKNFWDMDIARSLLKKSIIFGVIIALVGCIRGFETRGGASGVGRAVTSSVVTSMILIFLANAIITLVRFR